MSKKSRSTTGPSKEFAPFIRRGADALGNAYDSNRGAIQGMADEYSGLIGDFATSRLRDGDPGVNAARQYNMDVLSGNYMNANPYLDQMVNDTNEDIVNQSQASLGLRGLTGGSSYADIISRNVARNTTNIRGQEYGRERGAMENAAGRAGSIAQAEYLPIQGLLASLNAQQAPLNAASQYAGSVGGLLGGYQTTTSQRSPWDYIAQAAGNAATAFAASERRVKRDIQQIGTLSDGLGVYEFRYKWDADDAPLHVGVMVDEVETLRPWALGPVVDGIQTVDYGKLEQV